MLRPLTLLLVALLLTSAWAQPVSDPGKTFTVMAPKGWAATVQGKGLALLPPDESGCLGLMPRDSIPLEDAAAMKTIVGSLAEEGWKVGWQSPATVGGLKALRVELEGVGGDYAQDRGVYYFVSEPRRGLIIMSISTKAASRKNQPLMEAAVRSLTFTK